MKKCLLFSAILLSGCQGMGSSERILKYYDTRGWMEELVAQLEATQPEIEKTWMYDGRHETKKVAEIDWEKELKLFLDADLNKSSFVTSYDSVKDGGKIVYRLKAGESLPIRELGVVLDSMQRPTELYCIRQSGNSFFATSSEVRLRTHGDYLEAYEIRSVQKLLWFRPDSSYVSGKK